MKRKKWNVSKYDYAYQATIINIIGKYSTN